MSATNFAKTISLGLMLITAASSSFAGTCEVRYKILNQGEKNGTLHFEASSDKECAKREESIYNELRRMFPDKYVVTSRSFSN